MAEPVALLWTDANGPWLPLSPAVSSAIPELYALAAYKPEQRNGPDKADFPWFWGWDERTQDFPGGKAFDGNRWNNLHYSNAIKQTARDRKKGTQP